MLSDHIGYEVLRCEKYKVIDLYTSQLEKKTSKQNKTKQND